MKALVFRHTGTAIRIVISLTLVCLLMRIFDLSSIPVLFSGLNWYWICYAVILIFVSVVVSAWKWRALTRAQALDASFGEVFAAYLTGLFFNNFLPSSMGGDAARAIAIGKPRHCIPAAVSSVLVERSLAMTSLAVTGLIGAALSMHSSRIAVSILSALFVLSLAINAMLVSGYLPVCIRNGSGRFANSAREAVASATLLRAHPLALISSLIGAFIFQLVVAAVFTTVLLSLGKTIGFPDIVFIASASSALAMFPVGINGYGLREGSFAFLLAPYGIPADIAISTSLLFSILVAGFSVSGLVTWLASSRGGGLVNKGVLS